MITTAIQSSVEPNTARAYRSAVRNWQQFCAAYGLAENNFNSNAQFHRFVGHLMSKGCAASTLKTYTSSVRAWAKAQGHRVCRPDFVETKLIKSVARAHGAVPYRKQGLTGQQFKAVCQSLARSPTAHNLMWKALITVATFALLRSEHFSETAAGRGHSRALQWADVLWAEDGSGVFLVLRKGKRQRAPVGVWLPRLSSARSCCPVAALRDWWRTVQKSDFPNKVAGPVFRGASGSALTYDDALSWVHQLGVQLGLGPTALGTHTFRRTGLWLAEAADMSEDECKLIGRWHSGVWREYSQRAFQRGQLCQRMAASL